MPEADDTIPFVSIKEEEFRASLQKAESPPVADPLLSALWWDAKGDWKRAHEIAQDVDSTGGSWVHAYLHRKEGDEWNAGYWYRRAGKPHCLLTFDQEWQEIVRALLAA
jgi:hypothetical protein